MAAAGFRILIADDEPHVVRVLRLALERGGYRVETVPNGEAALERIRRSPPDLLISDIQMPRLSGEQLCERIAAELPARAFPIVIMTSMTSVGEAHWSRRHRNLVLLEKPLSVRKLRALIETLLCDEAVAAEV
ncbi:MAG: response regulator [Gammaproteobacteria bacterium]